MAPALESAGALNNGTEVFCNVVLSGDRDAGAFAIIPGCGAEAKNYFDLQVALGEMGMNSVCVDPLYRLSSHGVRLQSAAAELAIGHLENKYGIVVANGYGHSWGGAKLASLLHHGAPPGIKQAVFHNTSGIENPFVNMAAHPFATVRNFGRELEHAARYMAEHEDAEPFDPFHTLFRLPVVAQHTMVAAHHRKLVRHLTPVKGKGIRLVGLWADHDHFFRLNGHPIFDENITMEDSVHGETQYAPERVAKELVKLARERP